ncbi:MAG: hypothetical protein HKP58_17065 [Desulfatitalea sp.]|nr:LPP20 family lipoprotein [Desulfatitalea sp.]NNK02125.1 hypothetical protein [Desulfatitalea sp.]
MKPSMFLLPVMLLLFACAGSPPKSDESEAQTYTAQRYLTAEAVGDSEGAAKRAAMAELAAVFQSRVRSEIQSSAHAYTTDEAGEQFQRQVDQHVEILSDVRLEGAQIGWVRPDERSGGFRALAVLDRFQAADRWGGALERTRARMDAGLQALDTIQGRLSRLAALNQLAELIAQMALLQSRLSVVGRPAMTFETDLAPIFSERAELQNNATLFVQIEGEAADAFAHRMGALVTARGFQLAHRPSEAAGLITGKVSTQPLALENRNVLFIRALAELAVIDMDTQAEIAALSDTVRKGHMDENEAARMAIDQLADQVAQKLFDVLGNIGVTGDSR